MDRRRRRTHVLRRAAPWLLALLGLLLWVGGAGAQEIDPTREDSAQIRFVHAALGLDEAEVVLDGETIARGLPAGDATAYGLVRPGRYRVDMRVGGRMASTEFMVSSGSSYTVVLAARDRILSFSDDVGADGRGRESVRLVNLSPGGVALLSGEAAITGLVDGSEASERAPVPAGTQRLTIVGADGAPVATTLPIPFQDSHFYSVFLTEGPAGPAVLVLSYPQSTGAPPNAPTWLPLDTPAPTPPPTATEVPAGPAATPVPTTPTPSPDLPVAGSDSPGLALDLILIVVGLLAMITALALQIRRAV